MDATSKLLQELRGLASAPYEEPDEENLPLCGPVEIKVNASWIPTTSEVFRSWTGRRRIWGIEYHGPVYVLGKPQETTYTGARLCPCAVCQETVEPRFRTN